MKCHKCGAEIPDNTKFCMYCGAKISDGYENNFSAEVSIEQKEDTELPIDGQETQGTPQAVQAAESKHAEDNIEQRLLSRWKALGPFGKLAVIVAPIIAILFTVSICTGKAWPIVFSVIQVIGFVSALLIHKGVISLNKRWPEYLIILAAILLSVLNINSYSWGKTNTEKNKPSKDPIISQEENKACTPCDAVSCVGKESSDVKNLFSSVGFTNITIESLNDLDLSENEKSGQVDSVTINGVSAFEGNQEFSATSWVLIKCHSLKTIPVPVSSDAVKDTDANDLVALFSGAGFIDISTDEAVDLDPDKSSSDFENTVSVGGSSSYSEKQKFPIDAKVSIVTHLPYEKYTVKLLINFVPNIMFSKYNVELNFGNETKTLTHGDDAEFEYRLKPGKYTLTFTSAESSSVKGSAELEISGDTEASYKISCTSDKINVSLVYVETPDAVGENEAMVPMSSSTCKFKNYSEVEDAFNIAGFTNITETVLYDIVWGWTSSGEVENVTIDGKSDFIRGNIFSKDAAIVITYHMPEDEDPSFIRLEKSHTDFVGMNYQDVEQAFKDMGFTNVITEEKSTSDASRHDGEVVSVSVDSRSFKSGDKFKPHMKVLISYYVVKISETQPGNNSDSGKLSYTTNNIENAKKGNTGVFAYKKSGEAYSTYYIIDFDEAFVYCFTDGNGNDTCERLKIESGDLNSVLIVTYHDGDSTWSNGLHFKWVHQPDHLVLEDNDHFEWDFYPTSLNAAMSIRAAKRIVDY